ncbi:LOW QUALITY PROTEIN: uncharacterized protein LOC144349697 [Saccoglossus kowalevskii]
MTALQTIIGLVLQRAHAGRMAFHRLNKLNVCISETTVKSIQKKLGVDFDQKVKGWKECIEDDVEKKNKLVRDIAALEMLVKEVSVSSSDASSNCTQKPTSINTTVSQPSTGSFTTNLPAKQDTLLALKMKISAKVKKETHHSVTLLEEFEENMDSHIPCVTCSSPGQHIRQQKISSQQKLQDLVDSPAVGFQIVGDNVDMREKVRHMTVDHQNRDYHMFQLMAVKNRIMPDSEDFSFQHKLQDVPITEILPTIQDNLALKEEFIFLVGRVLTSRFGVFKDQKQTFPEHIPHKYQNEAKIPSEYVMLGVLQKNEQYTEEMIEIAKYAHQFVPGHTDTLEDDKAPLCKVPFVGGQLTVERLRESLDSVCDGRTPTQRLEGIYPKLADWHALVAFYRVCWHKLYSTQSSFDIGTMNQLRNAVNRRNVCIDPGSDFNASKDFFDIYTEAHIISALMHYFSMDSIDGKPTSNFDENKMHSSSNPNYLFEVLGNFVDMFIMDQLPVVGSDEATSSLTCRYCGKLYKVAGYLKRHEKLKHGHNFIGELPRQSPEYENQDGIFNYACVSISMGLLVRNFQDAIKEGDGERVIRLYKFLMLHYKADGRHKYALESLYLLVQIAAILPPKEAHLLKWERFVNVKGGAGNNIPLDLHLEHQNKYFKEDAKSFGGKLTERAVNRVSRAVHSNEQILKNLDSQIAVIRPGYKHTTTSTDKDLNIILDHLNNNGKVFEFIPGRFHCAYPDFDRDPFRYQDVTKVRKWISKHLSHFEDMYSFA